MIKRIIARLDIKNNFLVKGMHLEGLRILGYPEFFAEKYFEENIDEIIFQDVVASLYKRNQLSSLTNKISKNIFNHIQENGIIVAPMIRNSKQLLTKFVKKNNILKSEIISNVLFVPNLSGVVD